MDKPKKATKGQIGRIVAMLTSGHISFDEAQEIIERKQKIVERKEKAMLRSRPPVPMLEIITVPDLHAAGLAALLNKESRPVFFHDQFAVWDFIQGERGKSYEVMTWSPKQATSTEETRRYFRTRGFNGIVPAFFEWLIRHKPQGYYVTIPSEDISLWHSQDAKHSCVPSYRSQGILNQLVLDDIDTEWSDQFVFVAFREIVSASV